jgi:hypothetical protein
MFYAGSFLSLIAGYQLFVLYQNTDVYFAWTIQSSLTAVTLGAFYWATMIVGILSAQEKTWVAARAAVPAVIVFTLVSLAATILHFDKFHFSSDNPITQVSTWAWLMVYTFEPPLFLAGFILQSRLSGGDPARAHPLSSSFRVLLVLQGLFAAGHAAALFFAPQLIIPLWPWILTPLTARALAAWLFAFAVIGFQASWENDWSRIGVALKSYILFGLAGLIAVWRVSGEMKWATSGEANYMLYLLSLLAVGILGWFRVRRIETGKT